MSSQVEFGFVIIRSDTKEYFYGPGDWGYNAVNAARWPTFERAFEASPKGVLFRISEHSWLVKESNVSPH